MNAERILAAPYLHTGRQQSPVQHVLAGLFNQRALNRLNTTNISASLSSFPCLQSALWSLQGAPVVQEPCFNFFKDFTWYPNFGTVRFFK